MLRPRNFIFLCLLIIIITGVFYAIVWKNAPYDVGGDIEDGYLKVALDLKDWKVNELHIRAIGYPLFLVLTNSFEPSYKLILIQLSLYLFSVFLLSTLLIDMRISRKFILLFLFMSLIPPSTVMTVYMMTETLTTFFLIVGVSSLIWYIRTGKTTKIIIAGIALAFSALVRPTYQLLFIWLTGIMLLFFLFSHLDRKRIKTATVSIILAFCLILGSFSWYNYINFGYFGLSPILGISLGSRTVRVIDILPNEYKDVREILINERKRLDLQGIYHHHTALIFWHTLPQIQQAMELNSLELNNYLIKMNLLLIAKAPLEYLMEVFRAIGTYWLPTTSVISNFHSEPLKFLWGMVHFTIITIFFFTLLFKCYSLLLVRRLPHKMKNLAPQFTDPFANLSFPFFISVSIIFYTMLVSTMVENGSARFRTPTDLLIFFVSTIGLHMFVQIGTHGQQTKDWNRKRSKQISERNH